jgi:hypothetical protein
MIMNKKERIIMRPISIYLIRDGEIGTMIVIRIFRRGRSIKTKIDDLSSQDNDTYRNRRTD